MAHLGHSWSVLFANIIVVIISRRRVVLVCGKCGVGAYTGFGGKLEGKDKLKVQGINERLVV